MKNLYNSLLLKQLYQLKGLGYNYTDAKEFSYQEQNALKLPNSIHELRQQATNCHLCSLSKSRNRVVFGEGNSNAEILFVGYMPLEIEDEKGKPFLGRGGEMLTAMIEKVLKLSRDEVYISNLLKCHPLSTQKGLETEIHTCKAYLFKEIEIIKPKIIVSLGEEAYHYLSNDSIELKKIRGSVIEKENYLLVPTYHPNFLLKNPSLKKEVFEDLQTIKRLL
jgi:DNA polymerase